MATKKQTHLQLKSVAENSGKIRRFFAMNEEFFRMIVKENSIIQFHVQFSLVLHFIKAGAGYALIKFQRNESVSKLMNYSLPCKWQAEKWKRENKASAAKSLHLNTGCALVYQLYCDTSVVLF